MIFRVVLDTNIIIAAYRGGEQSPNKEILGLWKLGKLDILYSDDILTEYAEKLIALGIEKTLTVSFLRELNTFGKQVEIKYFHRIAYPVDADDTAFVLCADNGDATHLITYDPHIHAIKTACSFQVCKPLVFLDEVRKSVSTELTP